LIHSFILDIPPYRYNSKNVSLKTAQKFYTLIRQAIYDHSIWYLIKQIKLYNENLLSPYNIYYNLTEYLAKQLKKLASYKKIDINEAICSYLLEVRQSGKWPMDMMFNFWFISMGAEDCYLPCSKNR